MRFVVDGMLGKLARWLRMLGHDVEYDSNLSDSSLLDLAEREQAVLLTRDEELHQRAESRRISGILITGDSEEKRLAEVAREYHVPLVIDLSQTRCPKCGSILAKVSKAEIADKVPPTSLKLYDEYWKCSNLSCGKTYWRGGHWRQIDLTLERARKMLEDSSVRT